MKAPVPPNEGERLEALRRYQVLDTAAEESLDNLTKLAAEACDTPIALISLVDEERQWFKSRVGLEMTATSRDVAFCAHAILDGGMFEVPDASADERFRDNPLVTEGLKMRFYAGAPLEVAPDVRIGTLCVIDRVPRKLSATQRQMLVLLRDQVVRELEIRRLVREQQEHERQLAESAARFRKLGETIREVFWIRDVESGRLLYLSPAYAEVWGRPVEDACQGDAEAWFATIHTDDRESVRETHRRAAGDGPFEIDYRIVRPDGTIRWIDERGAPLRDPNGEVHHLLGSCRDVTERRVLEDAQREEGAIAQALTRASSEILAALGSPELLDRLCRITADVMEADFSYTIRREAEHDTWGVVAGFERDPARLAEVRGVNVPTSMVQEELATVDRDGLLEVDATNPGTELEALDNALGMKRVLHIGLRRGDEVYGILTAGYRVQDSPFSQRQRLIMSRLSRLAALALEAASRSEDLEKSTRIKSYFVSTLSHELRGTFAVVSGIAELLFEESDRLVPDHVELVEVLRRQAHEGLDIIELTLQLFHAEAAAGVRSGEEEGEPVSVVMEALSKELAPPENRLGVKLVWDLRPDIPTWRIDPAKLKMIVRNLVGNAFKFTDAGRVTVATRRVENAIELSVTDTGAGISEQALPNLFDPFCQAHGSVSREAGGAGLGLYVVHRLVTLLGARIDVHSELGRGTRFRILLGPPPRLNDKTR